jgi:ribosome biogenesis protein ENP2
MNKLSKEKQKQYWNKHFAEKNIDEENINSIPGFSFPFFVKLTKETPNGEYIISTGSYPPQIKCFSLTDLNLKFQRNLDSDVVDFQILSNNWEKIVFLRSDGKLDFHDKSGSFYQIKIPEKGCDLTFDNKKLFLFIPGFNKYISILDFKEGKFLNSVKLSRNHSITCSGISNFNGLISFGTRQGKIEFWDPRIMKKCIGKINGSRYTNFKKSNSISSLRFSDKTENLFFSGFESGEVAVYDLRCFSPLLCKMIQRLTPVQSIRSSYSSNCILTSTAKSIQFWKLSTGKTKLFFTPKQTINHVCSIKNTGMVFFSLNSKNIGVKYFKMLGPLPSWSDM